MYRKIIVSLSLEHGIGEKAIEVARRLVTKDGTIIGVHVYEPMPGSASAYVSKEAVARAYNSMKQALEDRVAPWPDVEGVMLKGHSGRAIVDYAEEVGADCIIVGSHKPGMRDIFLGSTAARIVRHAQCSVHVLR
ncbi:universal stress protein [Oceanibium sediminis]|uniref:universal stress protein n=1 Tax=Oceanibium sediminis TaxID=2026339 RepID=UPI000DD3A884|nr:universal stress protein [Oceanibium sediminis]